MTGPTCHYCGKGIIGPVYQRVCGWARWRNEGGTNALRLRVTKDSFACRTCLDLVDSGIDPRTQPSLPGLE